MLRDDGRLLNELSLYRDPFSSLIVAFCSVISNLYAFFFFPGPFVVLGWILYPKSSHCGLMQPGEVSVNRLGNQMEVLWGNFPSSVLHFVLPALLCKRFRFVTQGLRGKARPQMGHDWQLQEEKRWQRLRCCRLATQVHERDSISEASVIFLRPLSHVKSRNQCLARSAISI